MLIHSKVLPVRSLNQALGFFVRSCFFSFQKFFWLFQVFRFWKPFEAFGWFKKQWLKIQSITSKISKLISREKRYVKNFNFHELWLKIFTTRAIFQTSIETIIASICAINIIKRTSGFSGSKKSKFKSKNWKFSSKFDPVTMHWPRELIQPKRQRLIDLDSTISHF